MSDINKRIHETAAKLAKVKAGSCRGCDGMGEHCHLDEHEPCFKSPRVCNDCDEWLPCPTCATLRDIAGQCWHEPKFDVGKYPRYKYYDCKHCGEHFHITKHNSIIYTVQIMRQLLEELGEWEGFKWFMVLNCSGTKVQYLNDVITTMSVLDIIDKTSSDDHMREVVVAYLEKRIMEVA